jgi:hypothetical protein
MRRLLAKHVAGAPALFLVSRDGATIFIPVA